MSSDDLADMTRDERRQWLIAWRNRFNGDFSEEQREIDRERARVAELEREHLEYARSNKRYCGFCRVCIAAEIDDEGNEERRDGKDGDTDYDPR